MNATANVNNATCCVDYCRTSFQTPTTTIVNNYKCGQSPFTAAELTQIQNQRKATRRRKPIHA